MKTLLLIYSAALALAIVGTAAAERGNGATVANDYYCVASPFATSCWDVHTVTNMTETPSGNASFVTNGVTNYTVTFPWTTCTYSRSDPVHLHWLTKAGEEQSHSERLTSTTRYDCGASSLTCTSRFEYHYANGQVQFQRPEFACTSPS